MTYTQVYDDKIKDEPGGKSKMKVSELAKILSVTSDTVRFYTREGLLKPVKSEDNGYKQYGRKELNRLRFILSARQLGFSVKDIEKILAHADHGSSACPLVRNLIEQRLEETEIQFQHARNLRRNMKNAIKQWRNLPDKEPTKEMICYLIESFS